MRWRCYDVKLQSHWRLCFLCVKEEKEVDTQRGIDVRQRWIERKLGGD